MAADGYGGILLRDDGVQDGGSTSSAGRRARDPTGGASMSGKRDVAVTQHRFLRIFMSSFERYLTLWVALCIVVGIALGHWFPGAFQAVGALEIAKVN